MESSLTRTERLDQLPFTPKHRKVLVGSGLGWALDAMDVGLVSFVVAALAVSWQLESNETSWIVSAGFIGMAIGASLGGLLADRIGRRNVFALTLIVFGIATGLSALSWSVAALIVFRFIAGLGLGSELPIASTLVSEFAPSRIRGRVVVILEAFWAVGWLVAALIGYFVVPVSDNGWRWALAIGAVPALYAVIVRWGLPESVRFLEAKGRHAEAEQIVVEFEESADGVRVPSETAEADPELVTGSAVGSLFTDGRAVRTSALWVVWFCVNFSYYGAFIWIPSILYASGYDLVRSFGFTVIITLAQLPGYLAAAWLVEAWGRRPTLATFLIGSAASAVLFGTATSETQIILFGSLLSFFNLGAWGALYAITPEMYPTAIRATGAGWAAGFGRIASIIAPLLVPRLLDSQGQAFLFVMFSIFFAIAAAAAFLLREQRGVVLAG